MDKNSDEHVESSSAHQRKSNVEWHQFGLTIDSTKSNGKSTSNYKEETKELFEHEQEVLSFIILHI